jgi:hypothetical protein
MHITVSQICGPMPLPDWPVSRPLMHGIIAFPARTLCCLLLSILPDHHRHYSTCQFLRITIRSVGESREDVNQELGTFCHLLYLGMITVGSRLVVAWSWTHWVLKLYIDQGTFQDVVAKMFGVSLLATFSNFTSFFLCCAILILSCMQEHFHLVKDVSI